MSYPKVWHCFNGARGSFLTSQGCGSTEDQGCSSSPGRRMDRRPHVRLWHCLKKLPDDRALPLLIRKNGQARVAVLSCSPS